MPAPDIATAHYAGMEIINYVQNNPGVEANPYVDFGTHLISVKFPPDHALSHNSVEQGKFSESLAAFLEAHGVAPEGTKFGTHNSVLSSNIPAATSEPVIHNYIEISVDAKDFEMAKGLVHDLVEKGNTGLTAQETTVAKSHPIPKQLQARLDLVDALSAHHRENTPETQKNLAEALEDLSNASKKSAPAAHTPEEIHAAKQAQFGSRAVGNGAALGVDLVNIGTALYRGDSEAAMASAGSALVNGVSVADDLLAAGGVTSGNVSGALGKVGIGATVVTTAVGVGKIGAEKGIDTKTQQAELVVETGVGFVAGVAAGTYAAAQTGALMGAPAGPAGAAAGFVVGAVVGAASSATVGYANRSADQAFYGAEDKRFGVNLDTKQNMVGLAHGKFRDQLADPKTGKVDLGDIETRNRFEMLLERDANKQLAIMKENESYAPRWLRSGKSMEAQESARSDLKTIRSAQTEVRAYSDELRVQKAHEQVAALKLDTNIGKAQQAPDVHAPTIIPGKSGEQRSR